MPRRHSPPDGQPDFTPPFCPNPDCTQHHRTHPLAPGEDPWFLRKGAASSRLHPHIPRFRCKHCGRFFSSQTFSVDYRLRLRLRCVDVLPTLFTCQGIRQHARAQRVHHKAVALRQSRLAAQALALHARLLRDALPESTLVFDGFENFAYSQDFPNNHNLLVGKHSELIWGFNLVFLLRKGRMTARQRARRTELEDELEIPENMSQNRARELFEGYDRWARARGVAHITLYSDKHPAYSAALKAAGLTERWHHERISSKRARTPHNPLFPVNYLDRLIRKDLAEAVRETTRMARLPQRQLERLAVFVAYHNCRKPFREEHKVKKHQRHVERVGLSREWAEREWHRLGTERVFPAREPLWEFHKRVWNRQDVLKTQAGKEYFPSSRQLGRLAA